jgi:hypothetical protein
MYAELSLDHLMLKEVPSSVKSLKLGEILGTAPRPESPIMRKAHPSNIVGR